MNYTRLYQEEVIGDFHALNSMEPAKQPQAFWISPRARSGGLQFPHLSRLRLVNSHCDLRGDQPRKEVYAKGWSGTLEG